eukprot:symbB.v1.2.007335.t1/scaffold412.1/size211423/6
MEPTEPISEAAGQNGVLYEVCYQSVWIRQAPDSKSEKVTKRMKKDRFRLFDFDATGNWGKLKVTLTSGEVDGWVMLHHPDLGDLIRTCEDDDDRGSFSVGWATMVEFSDRNMEDFATGHINASKPVNEWLLDKLAENVKVYCSLLDDITWQPYTAFAVTWV